jgi:Na+-transporting methylmalonyl-CoA/oxaloacetate decarboxylase gamma subunit
MNVMMAIVLLLLLFVFFFLYAVGHIGLQFAPVERQVTDQIAILQQLTIRHVPLHDTRSLALTNCRRYTSTFAHFDLFV